MIPSQFLRKENRPLCIAHRGASLLAPENTLASFAKAVELGADLIEFDVQLTHDEVPVVFHDAGLERTTDNWGDLDTTPLEVLRLCDAGKWFSPSFKGEKVPTLEETIHALNGKALMMMELKHHKESNTMLVDSVLKLIQQTGVQDQTLIVSYDLEILELVKKGDPQILTGANFYLPKRVTSWVKEDPQCVDLLSPRISVLDEDFLKFAEEIKKPVYTWTSDNKEVLKKWGDYPLIQALATNNPEIFFSVFPK